LVNNNAGLTFQFVTFVSIGYSQNAVYGELLGPGLLGSMNYERMISEKLSVRVGYGGLTVEGADELSLVEEYKVTAIPIGVNYFMGGNHNLVIGGGIDLIKVEADVELLGLNLSEGLTAFYTSFGYRYQKDTGGLVFGLNGYYIMFGDAGGVPTVGIDIGWAF